MQVHGVGFACGAREPNERRKRPQRIRETKNPLDEVATRAGHGAHTGNLGWRVAVACVPLDLRAVIARKALRDFGGDLLDAAAMRRKVVRDEDNAHRSAAQREAPAVVDEEIGRKQRERHHHARR